VENFCKTSLKCDQSSYPSLNIDLKGKYYVSILPSEVIEIQLDKKLLIDLTVDYFPWIFQSNIFIINVILI